MNQPLPAHERVAAEIRAELARRRLSGRKVARQLGWTEPYLSRRLTGSVPFNVSDLIALAELLEVPVNTFFEFRGGLRTAAPWTLSLFRAAA